MKHLSHIQPTPRRTTREPAAGRITGFIVLLTALMAVPACNKVYYGTWEALGVHKRDIMVDRVQEARDDQEAAKEQFASALEKFSAMFEFEGGELEAKYKALKAELDESEAKAADVTGRIDSVESVSEDLFDEWESELDQYTNADLRTASEKQLKQTRAKYDQMIAAMRKAESKMQPVLSAFRDQVLFLKHNLNARAIASIQGAADELETDVARLIAEMEVSIKEADAFIEQMGDVEEEN
jgi:CRISPR/Cas system CMR-associated protein Cmr5 small subunit